ncbi:hypothetical protein SteCoe_3609 [Stentor coeruleus]|uniref:Uncharacterized protein n=1 Tax=Stentor coeruleus TaxID=5963 RepID=A0A1R2CWN3_9CILI|nr:hypothetical protein SteCoe_3609 [Stentor coeruleus]
MGDLKFPDEKAYSVNVVTPVDEKPDKLENLNHETTETVEARNLSPARITKSVSKNPASSLNESTPGPGSYSLCLNSNSPAFSISKSPRSNLIDSSPGPGDYENKRLSTGPELSFAKSTRELFPQYPSPGPGDYNPHIQEHSYSSILIGKPKDEPKLNTPGPGSYNLDIHKNSQTFSISRSPRFQSKDLSPGPSDYNTEIKSHSPTCKIGKAKRLLLGDIIAIHSTEPGPTTYSGTPKIHTSSAFIIGKPKETISNSPGPAEYFSENLITRPKSSAFSIGNSKRPNAVRNNYPGPCDYNTSPRSNSQKYSFARTSRSFIQNSESPGPSYNPQSTLSKVGGVISPRFGVKEDISPGPGSYNNSPCVSPNKGFTIPKAEKYEKIQSSSVSPLSYDTNIRSTSPKFSFGKSRREELFKQDTNPEILYISKPNTSPKISLRGKPKDLKIDTIPGPGTYSTIIKNNSPMYSIGKSKREKPTENSPGPGEYTPKSLSKSFSCKFSKSERISLFTVNTSISRFVNTPYKPVLGHKDNESPPKVRKNNYTRIKNALKINS